MWRICMSSRLRLVIEGSGTWCFGSSYIGILQNVALVRDSCKLLISFPEDIKDLFFQMEIYLNRLIELVSSESSAQSSYDHKEMVLELLVRLYKIPGEIFSMLESRAVFFKYGPTPASFWIYFCRAFYKLNYNRRIDEQLGKSVSCWLGLSSLPGLTQ